MLFPLHLLSLALVYWMAFLWTIKYLPSERLRFCQAIKIPQQAEMCSPRGTEAGAVWELDWGLGPSQPLLFLQSLWLIILEANRASEHVATRGREQKRSPQAHWLVCLCSCLMAAPENGSFKGGSGSRATCWRNLKYASWAKNVPGKQGSICEPSAAR